MLTPCFCRLQCNTCGPYTFTVDCSPCDKKSPPPPVVMKSPPPPVVMKSPPPSLPPVAPPEFNMAMPPPVTYSPPPAKGGMCPSRNKDMCPSTPAQPDMCISTKCDKRNPGYGKVTVKNCFGCDLDDFFAAYTDQKGDDMCDKEK